MTMTQKKQQIIEVLPYDRRWIDQFEDEKALLVPVFGDNCLDLHHIGSTAIPCMSAKPTIDMLLVVHNIHRVDSCNAHLHELGYEAWGEYGIAGRRFFLKGNEKRTHHLHVFEANNHYAIDRHLSFRDYLIAHPEEAAAYEALKIALATEFRCNRRGYFLGKEAQVKAIEQRAMQWLKQMEENN